MNTSGLWSRERATVNGVLLNNEMAVLPALMLQGSLVSCYGCTHRRKAPQRSMSPKQDFSLLISIGGCIDGQANSEFNHFPHENRSFEAKRLFKKVPYNCSNYLLVYQLLSQILGTSITRSPHPYRGYHLH